MQYYYENSRGETVGPIDEDLIIEIARRGEINSETLVRNTMVRTFKPADKIPCLQNIVKKVSSAKEEASFKDIAKNLHRSATSIKAPPITYRMMAFALDLFIIVPLIILSYNLLKTIGSSVLGEEQAMSLFLATVFVLPISYYTLTLGLKAQTLGYWFFGIMVIKGEGDEVYFGRAFFLAAVFILTLPLEALFVFIFNRGFHEIISGTRIVNVKLG